MNLQDVFDQLTFGELSQLNIGGGLAGKVAEENYKRIIPHVNLGLAALYRRFPLKEGRVSLLLQPGRTDYPLTSAFAVSKRQSREPVRYLTDSAAKPFKDDILKLLKVSTVSLFGSTKPFELPLNDRNNSWSLSTPSALVLRMPEDFVNQVDVPDEFKTSSVLLEYRASHPLIVQDPDDCALEAENTTIELPYSHLEALLLFIASRVHNPIGMVEEFHSGNSYAAKYEVACRQLELDNVGVDQGSQNNRLRANGWV